MTCANARSQVQGQGLRARTSGYNTITIIIITTTGLWWHGGVWKGRFQQSDTTHSGTGEKETPNINVVGKKELGKLYFDE